MIFAFGPFAAALVRPAADPATFFEERPDVFFVVAIGSPFFGIAAR